MAGHWSRVASTPVRAAVTMVLLIARAPRGGALTGWVAPGFAPAQIEPRKVRWRGGAANHPGGGGRAPARCACLSALRVGGFSYRDVAVLPPPAVDLLGARLLDAADDHA